MSYNETFKVGDKALIKKSGTIGTVVKITPKRKDVVVDYGHYKERYYANGWQKNGDIWSSSKIYPLTPELEKELLDKETIKKCVLEMRKLNYDNFSVEKARKILEILKGDENGNTD